MALGKYWLEEGAGNGMGIVRAFRGKERKEPKKKKKKGTANVLGFGKIGWGIGYTHCLRDRLSCETFILLLQFMLDSERYSIFVTLPSA